MTAGLSFRNVGLVRAGRWLLRGLHVDMPPTGLVRLLGPDEGVAALGGLISRHVQPGLSAWGSITARGVDFRVAPPAALVAEDLPRDRGDVASVILARIAAPTLVRLVGPDVAQSTLRLKQHVAKVLVDHQLTMLAPTDRVDSLSIGLRLALELVAASSSAARVVWTTCAMTSLASAERAEVERLVRQLASTRLVVLAGPASEFGVGMGAHEIVLRDDSPEGGEAGLTEEFLRGLGLPGFRWIIAGQLAGMARPGSGIQDLQADVSALSRLSAVVVTLEESPVNYRELRAAGIECWHLPIVDMRVPSHAEARSIAEAAVHEMARGRNVVFHCRGGVGRTGTMLAYVLMARGHTGAQALELLRQINQYYVQSPEQMTFLEEAKKTFS